MCPEPFQNHLLIQPVERTAWELLPVSTVLESAAFSVPFWDDPLGSHLQYFVRFAVTIRLSCNAEVGNDRDMIEVKTNMRKHRDRDREALF